MHLTVFLSSIGKKYKYTLRYFSGLPKEDVEKVCSLKVMLGRGGELLLARQLYSGSLKLTSTVKIICSLRREIASRHDTSLLTRLDVRHNLTRT